jgi:hypothetical protein
MLWYKAWRETQYRLLFSLGIVGFYLIVFFLMRSIAPPRGAKPAAGFALTATSFVVVIYTWLAGAGIATQPAFQATGGGLYGSTQFTLSLPVSRFRLLAIRAGIGWLEMAGLIGAFCCGMWLAGPAVRGSIPAIEMFGYVGALAACASSLYFLSVLLATFLDDIWHMKGGMIAFGGLWALSSFVPLPASVDIVRAMLGDRSPLLAHVMPWNTMVFSLGLSTVLFFAALKIVQMREY